MPALTTVAVSNRTTSGCTITLNAAAVDLNKAQIQQLAQLFKRLAIDTVGPNGTASPATITIGNLG